MIWSVPSCGLQAATTQLLVLQRCTLHCEESEIKPKKSFHCINDQTTTKPANVSIWTVSLSSGLLVSSLGIPFKRLEPVLGKPCRRFLHSHWKWGWEVDGPGWQARFLAWLSQSRTVAPGCRCCRTWSRHCATKLLEPQGPATQDADNQHWSQSGKSWQYAATKSSTITPVILHVTLILPPPPHPNSRDPEERPP